jgi:CheY-like chemotaxis protein
MSATNEEQDMSLSRILHVDDDDDIRTIVQLALEVVGNFDVLQFSNGHEAVAAAPGFAPQLLLLDVMMPEMSGLDVWKSIVAMPGLSHVPAIFVTAKAEDAFSRSLVSDGALAVITKPFDPMTLAQQIEGIWEQAKHKAG